MYNKMKYAVYAALGIIVFFVVMDIGSRYSKMADKNKNESQNIPVQNVNPPQQTYSQQNNADTINRTNSAEISDTEVHDELSPEEMQAYIKEKRKMYRLDPSQIAEEEKPAPKTEEEIYNITLPDTNGVLIFEDGKKAEGYKICNSFNIEKDVYSIFSIEDSQSAGEYSQVINRKYYLYKKEDDKFYRSNYLFDISAPKDKSESADISVTKEKYQVVIKGNSNTVRRLNNYNLKTNYYQYKSLPALLYLPPAQNSSETLPEADNTGVKNTNDMENSDLH